MLYKKTILFVILFLVFFVSCLAPACLAQTAKEQFDNSLKATGEKVGYDVSKDEGDKVLSSTIAKVIQIVLSFVGVIFLMLMIYAGFVWMTAAGNEDRVEKAKKTIIASVVGLIIVLSAYAISYLVVAKFGESALLIEVPEAEIP